MSLPHICTPSRTGEPRSATNVGMLPRACVMGSPVQRAVVPSGMIGNHTGVRFIDKPDCAIRMVRPFSSEPVRHPSSSPPIYRVPALIKRNTALFALSQSFTGSGMQFAFGLGPLMVVALTDSASLAGLSVALIGLSRFLVAYPVGKITDTYGRKPGILLGLALGLAGSIVVGLSVS